jgi:hypothetical protein
MAEKAVILDKQTEDLLNEFKGILLQTKKYKRVTDRITVNKALEIAIAKYHKGVIENAKENKRRTT